MQKARHGLKERGQEVGIEHFNLDRIASNTMSSHRLVQWVTKTLGPTHSGPPHNPLLACLVKIRCDQLNQRHFPQPPSPELSTLKTPQFPPAEALYDLLNQRHFVEGRKLNDHQMLAEAANTACGIDTAQAMAFLESGEVSY